MNKTAKTIFEILFSIGAFIVICWIASKLKVAPVVVLVGILLLGAWFFKLGKEAGEKEARKNNLNDQDTTQK